VKEIQGKEFLLTSGIIFSATVTSTTFIMGRKPLSVNYISESAKCKSYFDNKIAGVFKKVYQIYEIFGVPFCLGVENEDETLYYYIKNLDIFGSLCDAQRLPNKRKFYNLVMNTFSVNQSIPNLTSSYA
ncbi:hypothetical protein KI387_033653, partial [Taxus chinensis]